MRGPGSAELRVGPLSSDCSSSASTSNVGRVVMQCSALASSGQKGNSQPQSSILSFQVSNTPGTTAEVYFFVGCSLGKSGSCEYKKPEEGGQYGLRVDSVAGVMSFGHVISDSGKGSAGCPCDSVYWGVMQVGKFNGLCPLSAPAGSGKKENR